MSDTKPFPKKKASSPASMPSLNRRPRANAPCANPLAPQVVAAVATGSVAGRDPRIGGLSREDAFQIKAFAEAIGAADCMPAWMAREIAEKTSSTADGKPLNT